MQLCSSVTPSGQGMSRRPGNGWEAAHLRSEIGPTSPAPITCVPCNWLIHPVGGASMPWSSGHVMPGSLIIPGESVPALVAPGGGELKNQGQPCGGGGGWVQRLPGDPHQIITMNLCIGGWFMKRTYREPQLAFKDPACPLVREFLVKISWRNENRII